ncbi:hypothetical protein SAMN05443144_11580 [Fodinibius roseus]|uniref:Uncharacterized protein n=1 Tax=Fodinibius roseus TaxID=1194090 RepID=A0A1M5FNP8_9BACT|nr:hypothetical protein SAMN05443144_11580 [Fodinibius roseus]
MFSHSSLFIISICLARMFHSRGTKVGDEAQKTGKNSVIWISGI